MKFKYKTLVRQNVVTSGCCNRAWRCTLERLLTWQAGVAVDTEDAAVGAEADVVDDAGAAWSRDVSVGEAVRTLATVVAVEAVIAHAAWRRFASHQRAVT